MKVSDLTIFALDMLLEYAKLLEEKDLLSYDLLKQRVDSYRKGVKEL